MRSSGRTRECRTRWGPLRDPHHDHRRLSGAQPELRSPGPGWPGISLAQLSDRRVVLDLKIAADLARRRVGTCAIRSEATRAAGGRHGRFASRVNRTKHPLCGGQRYFRPARQVNQIESFVCQVARGDVVDVFLVLVLGLEGGRRVVAGSGVACPKSWCSGCEPAALDSGSFPGCPNGGMTDHRLGCPRVPEPCREIAGSVGGDDAGRSAAIHGGMTSKVRSGSRHHHRHLFVSDTPRGLRGSGGPSRYGWSWAEPPAGATPLPAGARELSARPGPAGSWGHERPIGWRCLEPFH